MSEKKKHSSSPLSGAIQAAIVIGGISFILQLLKRDEPLYHIIPNILLFTPLHVYCPRLWRDPFKYLPEEREHGKIPEIQAVDYTYDKLREVTENFRVPAVIRGIFKDSDAVKMWHKNGYLQSKLGEHEIAVMRKGNPYEQADRFMGAFKDAWTELLKNSKSTISLFFPVLSRFQYDTTAIANTKRLQEAVENLIREDMKVNSVIWDGFSMPEKHSNFHAMQLVMGRGAPVGQNYTGLAWVRNKYLDITVINFFFI